MNRIKELRKKNHLTQHELGSLLHLSQQQIQKYESGILEPKASVLVALADLFHTNTDYILMRTETSKDLNINESEQNLVEHFRTMDIKTQCCFMQLFHLYK